MKSKDHHKSKRSLSSQNDLGRIESWYQEIQSPFDIYELDKDTGNRLLDSQANANLPIHSWYVLKEASSFQLPLWVIERLTTKYKADIQEVLDPFLGCGTTGMALSTLNIRVDGLEYNPFIRFVASLKANANHIEQSSVMRFAKSIKTKVPKSIRLSWPVLSTLHNPWYFRKSDIRYLLYVLQEIENRVRCEYTRDFLRLGVAKSLEPISNLRKDGRALRYIKKHNRPIASELLPIIWQNMLKDISETQVKDTHLRVYSGDARNLADIKFEGNSQSIPEDNFDLVLYSPPYLNNFDYSEIYKLELWILGFVSTYDEWRCLRKSTIRSHHSLKFLETNELGANPKTSHISERIKFMANSACLTGHAAKNMPSVIKGYFNDMYLALKEQYRVLRPGGFLVYIVANSRHSDLPIATDVILGEIATNIGFQPIELNILKKRNGRTRQKNFLRESAVFMQKPE